MTTLSAADILHHALHEQFSLDAIKATLDNLLAELTDRPTILPYSRANRLQFMVQNTLGRSQLETEQYILAYAMGVAQGSLTLPDRPKYGGAMVYSQLNLGPVIGETTPAPTPAHTWAAVVASGTK